MKRKLLILVMLLTSLLNMQAFSTGDYVYTKNGRYKVVSEKNLLVNGDFAEGLNGWTSDGTTEINNAVFTVVPDEQGKRYLQVNIMRNAVDGGGLFQNVKIESLKSYVVYYKVKSGAESSVTSIKANGNNYQSLFTNSDGSSAVVTTQLNAIRNYSSEWTEVAYEFVAQDDYLNLFFYRLPVGECFADFGVYEVEEISDDRKVKEAINVIDFYKGNTLFPNAQDMLDGISQVMQEMLSVEDYSTVATIIDEFYNNALPEFLNANTVDATQYLVCPNFDDAKVIKDQQSLFGGGWTATGTRWLAKAANNLFATTYIERSIGGKYKLPEGEIYQSINLPSGKYMFTMKMLAKRYANGDDHLEEDYDIRGIKLFVNDDSVECTPIYPNKAAEYTVYADIKNDGYIKVGAYIPADVCNVVLLDNTELRLIGGSADQLEQYVENQNLTGAMKDLKSHIDSAQVLVASPFYLYEKDMLSDSIAVAQVTYETATVKQQLVDRTRYIGKAIAYFYDKNKEYYELSTNIDYAKALLADEKYESGKPELNAAITVADNYIKSLTAVVRDSAGIVQHNDALITAVNAFFTINSSFALPGTIGLVNPDFIKGTDGWTYNIDPNKKAIWQSKDNSKFSNGHALVYSRGRSAADPMFVWQDVDVIGKGLYEFSAEVVAWNTEWSYPEETGVKLFVGNDSITLRTDGNPKRFRVRTVVDKPSLLRVGLDAQNNVRCCEIMISGCQLLYYGDYDKYKKDSLAAEIEPTRIAIQKVLDEAYALKAASRNPNGIDTTPFDSAIADAENAKNGTDISMMNSAVTSLKTAMKKYMLSGVWPAEGEYFDLTFSIEQPDFGGNGTKYSAWTVVGAQPTSPEGTQPYLTYYFGKDVPLTSSIMQRIEGMPQGDYRLMCEATYRLKLTNDFNYVDYEAMMPVWLVANDDSTAVRGLLTDADEQYVDNILKYSLDDYRHGRNIDRLFDAGFFTNTLAFALEGANTINIGLSVVGIPITSGLWADGFELRYYGKDVDSGIEGIEVNEEEPEQMNRASVYTISGIKVATGVDALYSLPKGIYIINGKKIVR